MAYGLKNEDIADQLLST
ncbi:hypothetical protein VQ056_29500 [Paenibacillus sp. JTLBN-2024]